MAENEGISPPKTVLGDRESEYLLGRLKNQLASGEGSNVPPQLRGGVRIPLVTGLKILSHTTVSAGDKFVLTWWEPEGLSNISHYNVLAMRQTDKRTSLGQTMTTRPPAIIILSVDVATAVSFRVQTVLKNGLSSSIDDSPSCAALVSP